ncbi:hypothetical protein WN66_05529 [Saccharomyces cerevisiae]|nr:hypothetical protein WN66_05529 [Saccharomyces cerevisiae]
MVMTKAIRMHVAVRLQWIHPRNAFSVLLISNICYLMTMCRIETHLLMTPPLNKTQDYLCTEALISTTSHFFEDPFSNVCPNFSIFLASSTHRMLKVYYPKNERKSKYLKAPHLFHIPRNGNWHISSAREITGRNIVQHATCQAHYSHILLC